MSRSTRSHRLPRSLVIHRKVAFTVREAPFRTFDTLKQLDVQRLTRAARARFEVGWFESGCSQRIVHAIVEKGRVTRLEIEPCPHSVRMSAELRSVAQAARKALAARRRTAHSLPVSVEHFLSNAAAFRIDIWGCFTICGFGYCLECCFGFDDPKMNECHVWVSTSKI
jgi:hypothetical protein